MDRIERPGATRGPHLLAAPAAFFLGLLAFLSLARIALAAWLHGRVVAAEGWGPILLGGLRMDLVLLCTILLVVVPLTLVLGGVPVVRRPFALLLRTFLAVLATALVAAEVMTPRFVLEFDTRPDRLLIEYLAHPREIFAMLLAGYRAELVASSLGVAAVAWLLWRGFGRLARSPRRMTFLARIGWAIVLLPLLFLGARSSLGHRPANPSSVVFSGDHLMNDLALSSGYSVLYALYSMRQEETAARVYGTLESDERMIELVKESMATVAATDFVSDAYPTFHRQVATVRRDEPLDLVIVLEESLGAQFVGALGGAGLTPELDSFAEHGWWFEQMYATGTRSVRGIEAVLTGFLPTPATAVVKLGKAQSGFFTLASLLRGAGYHTRFVYGGESHFDNMASFFSGNGFAEIIDQDDFEDPRFVGSWGVSDEDIFERAHEVLMEAALDPDAPPQFTLVFSVSNHSPFEYPEGRIPPNEHPVASVENAVRYADHALGAFLRRAKESPYWNDAVFLVVADHDARAFGASLVPIRHFHVPALILGREIEPRRDPRLASQIDLAPTLLSLMGLDSVHPMIGHDLTREGERIAGRAIMQYGENQAFMQGRDVVVLQPHLAPQHFDYVDRELVPAAEDAALAERALAHALLPSWLYEEGRYPERPDARERVRFGKADANAPAR